MIVTFYVIERPQLVKVIVTVSVLYKAHDPASDRRDLISSAELSMSVMAHLPFILNSIRTAPGSRGSSRAQML